MRGSAPSALRTGYRHIDTAAAYGNEREVGEGIRRSGVDRSAVFVETKVWISDYGYDATLHAFDKSAGKLGVEHLDLLILHQALPSRYDLTIDAYRALEQLLPAPPGQHDPLRLPRPGRARLLRGLGPRRERRRRDAASRGRAQPARPEADRTRR